VRALLASRSPARVRLLNALMSGDEPAARTELDADPSIMSLLTREDHGLLAVAIFYEHVPAAEVMLSLGFDPAAPGIDGGSALHAACWVGHVRMVERLIERGGVELDARDPEHAARVDGVRIGAPPRARLGLPHRRRAAGGRRRGHQRHRQRPGALAAVDGGGQHGDAGRAAPPRRTVAT
jgi:ankyrin repeat protein